MRVRFCATMRRPACSIIALIAPVRLRAVASGLMIEKVRSSDIGLLLFKEGNGKSPIAAAYSGRVEPRQDHRENAAGKPPLKPRRSGASGAAGMARGSLDLD